MKINWINLVKDNDTISATNESVNYPVENIYHTFLRKRFQSSTTSSLITIIWSSDQTASCFFYGWHNLTGITITYKNSVDATIYTNTISDIQDIGVEHFTELTTIRKLEISISSSSTVYLGGISTGICRDFEGVSGNYNHTFVDNSNVANNASNQGLQGLITPLRSRSYRLNELTLVEKNTFDNDYELVGAGGRFWIDLFEGSRNTDAPMYCFIPRGRQPRFEKIGRRYYTTLNIEEAR